MTRNPINQIYLMRLRGMRIRDIADQLGVSFGHVQRELERLQKAGANVPSLHGGSRPADKTYQRYMIEGRNRRTGGRLSVAADTEEQARSMFTAMGGGQTVKGAWQSFGRRP